MREHDWKQRLLVLGADRFEVEAEARTPHDRIERWYARVNECAWHHITPPAFEDMIASIDQRHSAAQCLSLPPEDIVDGLGMINRAGNSA